MTYIELYEAGLEAAVGDYDDKVSPYCEGYKEAFERGYHKGWKLINMVLEIKANDADRLPD
jgi:hypothetical protein